MVTVQFMEAYTFCSRTTVNVGIKYPNRDRNVVSFTLTIIIIGTKWAGLSILETDFFFKYQTC